MSLPFFLLWWNAVRDPGVWGTIWNKIELTWKVTLQYFNISELIPVVEFSRQSCHFCSFICCVSEQPLAALHSSQQLWHSLRVLCGVWCQPNSLPWAKLSLSCSLQLSQFSPCVCWRQNPAAHCLWSLDLLSHILDQNQTPAAAFWLRYHRSLHSFIVWVLGFVCCALYL